VVSFHCSRSLGPTALIQISPGRLKQEPTSTPKTSQKAIVFTFSLLEYETPSGFLCRGAALHSCGLHEEEKRQGHTDLANRRDIHWSLLFPLLSYHTILGRQRGHWFQGSVSEEIESGHGDCYNWVWGEGG
jgi:hypothetical protein